MTENEIKLIKLIHESDNREESIITAVSVITSFLAQHESSQLPSAGSQPEQV